MLLVATLPRSTAANVRTAPPRPVESARREGTAVVLPQRNLFRFVERALVTPPPPAARSRPIEQVVTPQPSATPEAIRVLGIVRQGNGLRALLGFRGDTSLVGIGGRFAGYEVIGLDGETVRLRSLSGGAELSVELPLD